MKRAVLILSAAGILSACGGGSVPAEAGQETSGLSRQQETRASDSTEADKEEWILQITAGDTRLEAVPEDNRSAEELRELLSEGELTVEMEDYGGFEKVGPLGTALTRCDEPITAEPGDVILYQGNQITIYYGTNSWNFTRLARIKDPAGLEEALGEGTVPVTFSLAEKE